jgi:ABC-2 type transport system permease protein
VDYADASAAKGPAERVEAQLTRSATVFVPTENLPSGLRTFAEWNPVSSVTQAVRELFGNIPPGTPEPTAWSLQHPALYTLIWIAVIIGIFAPLSVRQYKRANRS